jgi:hypothetical protein
MALKSMTLTAGPNATGGKFGFRFGPGTEAQPKAGRIEFTDKPVKVPLGTEQARKSNLEKQLSELVRAKYLVLIDKEEADARPQR